jgi:hypothetical protein
LNEEHRLRVFKNSRVLRKIFWTQWDGWEWEWRRIYNEEFYDFSSLQRITQMVR